MSTTENKEIVRNYIIAYSDMSGASSQPMLADDAQIHLMSRNESLPLPKVMGKYEYLALFPAMASLLPNGIRHEVKSMIAEGDFVAVETECFGPLADGRSYNNLFHFLIEVRDGKIVLIHEYLDFLHTKEALFDTPPQGAVKTASPTVVAAI
ncbi:nuclear transport factor 2 family protein [Rhodococcus qingshengii]|uniref:nuclear transport factor 2 family protein n=1 Tax=Rhodococcus qingshengii TaxID=334542 RepID=UPI0037C9B5D1